MVGKLLQEKPVVIKTALQENSEDRKLDRLELLPYAEALAKFIETSDTPMTVGLQGDWGTGKTSMLNMLRGTEENAKSGLLNSNQCLVINFETWSYAQFNDRKSLPMACLFALTGKLEEGLKRQKGVSSDAASDAFKKATGKLSSVLKKSLANASVGVMGISIPVGKALQDDEAEPAPDDLSKQMMEFRDNFSEMVELWVSGDDKRRVVICVDDLDRVQPVIALELLESIKNFLDVEGCVFVLAVDYEVVQQGMKEKLGVDIQKTSGKSFFDKIIQLPFNMPKSSYDLKTYIGDLIEIAGFPQAASLKSNDLEFLEEITLCSIGGNPRSIKRVMNYARLLNIIREKTKAENRVSRDSDQKISRFTSRDSKILYSLICMQIAWPEIFTHFMSEPTTETIQNLESWEYLEKTPELKPLFDRSPDSEKLKNDISAFIDNLFSMIDDDGNGQLSDQEFEPVQKVLEMARFTNAQPKPRPRDLFVENALKNASKDGAYEVFIEETFKRSKVYTSTEIKYRPAGKRYVTLVYKRKQLGSVVTLKNHPLIIRLNGQPDSISREVARILENEASMTSVRYVRDFEQEEGSLTGFGDAIVDVVELMKMESRDQLRILNAIITATERLLQ